jgi:hypothetical protein
MQEAFEKLISIEDIDNPDEEEPYFEDPTSTLEDG